MQIGLDDTDSTKGGCTTYLAAVLIEKLKEFNVQFFDYPALIRLNPNVPWKTRGNGALCLRFNYDAKFEDQITNSAMELWETHSAIKEKGTDPGIVVYKNTRNSCGTESFLQENRNNNRNLKRSYGNNQKIGR